MKAMTDYQKLASQKLSKQFFNEEELSEKKAESFKEKYRVLFDGLRLDRVSGRFLNPVENGIAVSRLTTGFKSIDLALGGGIAKGDVAALSGAPSVGKSTFALQMAENMASEGNPVLYFSYEMSKEQVAAKSIGRNYYLTTNKKKGFSAIDLLNMEKWSGVFADKGFLKDYEKAVERAQGFNKKILFFDCTVEPLSIDDIETIVNNYIEVFGELPVIFIDYLHMIPSPVDENGTEIYTGDKARIDYNMKSMRRISSNLNCTIIFISALRKDDFRMEADMAGLMGSSAIPYNCDLILGLQYAAVNDPGFNVEAEQNRRPRRVELVVTKSRYYGVGKKVKLHYYNEYDYFEEGVEKRAWNTETRRK